MDVKIINEQTTAVDIALLNAVGMLQKNEGRKGNIVISDPSYIYLGNLTQEENITILGTDTSYKQVKQQHLPLLVANDDNKGIYKIFDKFNTDKINNTAVRESYNQRYDIDRSFLTKLPVYSGLIGINLNNMQIFNFIEITRKYVETYDGEKQSIDFIAHILIPVLRIINNENMNSYLEKLKEDITDTEDRKQFDNFFRGLFNEYKKFLTAVDFTSVFNLKVEHSSVMTKVQNDDFYSEFVSYLQSVQNSDNNDDVVVLDISKTKKEYPNMSFVAEIDFDSYTYEQLKQLLSEKYGSDYQEYNNLKEEGGYVKYVTDYVEWKNATDTVTGDCNRVVLSKCSYRSTSSFVISYLDGRNSKTEAVEKFSDF